MVEWSERCNSAGFEDGERVMSQEIEADFRKWKRQGNVA